MRYDSNTLLSGSAPLGGAGRGSLWATASKWPQNSNPSQVCPQSLPSTSHWALPMQWLGSGSPSKLLCTCYPMATTRSPAAPLSVAWLVVVFEPMLKDDNFFDLSAILTTQRLI